MAASKLNEVIQHIRRIVLLRDGGGLTDGQLMDEFINRQEEAALAALVRRHSPMVWGVCSRTLRDQHDAEDAFQSTFLVFVRKAASVVPKEMIGNWLYGVAHQTALNARAKATRRRKLERPVTDMPEPRQEDQWHDMLPYLDQELIRLPNKYRAVAILCDLEGKTRQEAAKQLGLPEGTVATQLARARTMLAKRLARHGGELSGGTLAAVLSQNVASADVPHLVVSSTITAANSIAAGHAASGLISAKVAALTEGVLKTMLLKQLKMVTTILLVLGSVVTYGGGRLLTHYSEAVQQVEKLIEKPKTDAGLAERSALGQNPSKPMDSPFGAWTDVGAEYGWIRIDDIGGSPSFTAQLKGTEVDKTYASPFSKDVIAEGHYSAVRFAKFPTDKLRLLPVLETCTRLWLDGSSVDDDNLREVALLKNLEWLAIYRSTVTDVGLKNLAGLKHLRRLGLHRTNVTDAGMKDLARHTGLEALGIGGTAVTDAGFKELAGLKQMRLLDLYGTSITDAGMATLAGFTQMETLYLSEAVTDQGLEKLVTLSKLKHLATSGKVTDEGRSKLQRSLPGVRIDR